MNPTKDQIRSWLTQMGKDREWLAQQCGVSKGTVDQWFYRGFSDAAVAAISNLMKLHSRTDADDTGLIQFTTSEFEEIEKVRFRVGDPPRPQFYRDAILQFVEQILDESAAPAPAPGNILPLDAAAEGGESGATRLTGPPDPELARAARKKVTYRGGKKP